MNSDEFILSLTSSAIYDTESNERFDLTLDVAAAIFICLYNYIAADIYRGRHQRNSFRLRYCNRTLHFLEVLIRKWLYLDSF